MNDVDDRDLLTGLANAGTARRQLGDWLQADDARGMDLAKEAFGSGAAPRVYSAKTSDAAAARVAG